jgi:dCMP deaminase
MKYPISAWDMKLLEHSKVIASWSRDPSTKVGAVIVRPDRTIASTGYNGFPRGVVDHETRLDDRQERLLFTVHAELNAILMAREPLHGYTMYVTHFPCAHCAAAIVQSGIRFVFTNTPSTELKFRWAEHFIAAHAMFDEAGVHVVETL